MMRKTRGQLPGPVLNDDTTTGNEETGILSVITEERVIRRAYLNNRMIAVEIDTCSLTSIIISEDPKLDRVIRIKKKLSAQILNQKIHEYKQKTRIRTERDVSREETRSDTELTSDDPRKGGKKQGAWGGKKKILTPTLIGRNLTKTGMNPN